MHEMIERVTNAIKSELGKQGVFINYAPLLTKAAIEAMREPTDAMLNAGASRIENNFVVVRRVWRAMIDEVLK